MSKATTVQGTARQRIKTTSGLFLERGYVYLPNEVWRALYELSSRLELSASEYICNLINIAATDGTAYEKDSNNENTRTNPRNE